MLSISLPLQTIKRLMKSLGKVERIQDEAVELVAKDLTSRIEEYTQRAKLYMEHAGRVTLQKEDMELAISILRQK